MIGSKVIAFTNRYSCLALPDLLLTEYWFHIQFNRKGPPKTIVKFWSRYNGMIKSYGPFEPLLLPGATRPPPHRVSIPQPLYGNRHPETHLNLDRDSTIGSKVMARSNRYSCLARPDLSHRVSIRHPLYGKGHPKTRVKFRSRSNGRIKSYCLYEPLL